MKFLAILIVLVFSSFPYFANADSKNNDEVSIQRLTCDYRSNPMGVDDVRPALGWQIIASRNNVYQSAYRILVASSPELLNGNKGDVWDSGKIVSSQSQGVRCTGDTIIAGQRYFWKVKIWDEKGLDTDWSKPAWWSSGLLNNKDWEGYWISNKFAEVSANRNNFTNWKSSGTPIVNDTAAIYMRKTFALDNSIKSATAYITGLGYYELYLNGNKIGEHVLDPVFSDYQKTVYYVTYDVTSNLKNGVNAIGVILGNGFYNSPTKDLFQFEKANWKTPPKLLFILNVEFKNGKKITIVSDSTWKWDIGEISYNSIRSGETIDHRRSQEKWNLTSFKDKQWKNVVVVPSPIGKLSAQTLPPMKVCANINPIKIFSPRAGTYVVDFGENITGWISLKAKGVRGQKIQCWYNEALNKDSTLNITYSSGHTGKRFQRDDFILTGNGLEIFEPRFTYHGFRYVQLNGLTSLPSYDDIQAKSIHTALDTLGSFECSDAQINNLHLAVQRTLLNGIHGMPAEEPTREKVGWTWDAGVTMESYLYNFNAITAYRKSLQDFIDAQEISGHIPPVVPTNGWGTLNAKGELHEPFDDPWWGGAIFVIADKLFEFTGDTTILDHAFDALKAYVDFVASTSRDDLVYWSLGDWLDLTHGSKFISNPELLPIGLQETIKTDPGSRYWGPGITPIEQTSTLYYYWMNHKVSGFARLLGKDSIGSEYARNAARIKTKFNKVFLDKTTGWYSENSQTIQALALFFDIPPTAIKHKVLARLQDAITSNKNHVNVGFIGVYPLLNFIPDASHMKKVYDVFSQRDSPGWLHMVENEKSTLGENLNSKGYGTGHHPFGGHVGSFLYKYLGGIRPDPTNAGWKKFIIDPFIAPDLSWLKSKTQSPYGQIISSWKKENGMIVFNISIPANTSATVMIPSVPLQSISIDRKLLKEWPFIQMVETKNEKISLRIPSGKYELTFPDPGLKN
jgi:alpha-L-rhamnosidase